MEVCVKRGRNGTDVGVVRRVHQRTSPRTAETYFTLANLIIRERVHVREMCIRDRHFAAVVEPGHAEHEDAFGLGDALEDFGFMIFGMAFQHGLQGIEDFHDGLVEFGFGWVFGFDEVENLSGVVGRRVLFGRFHNSAHRLASEFLCVVQVVKKQDAAELRLW